MRILQTDLIICFVEIESLPNGANDFAFYLSSILDSLEVFQIRGLIWAQNCFAEYTIVCSYTRIWDFVFRRNLRKQKSYLRGQNMIWKCWETEDMWRLGDLETWRRSFKIILSLIENICRHSCKKKIIWMLLVYSSVKIVLKKFMIFEFGKNAKQVAKTEFGRRWP